MATHESRRARDAATDWCAVARLMSVGGIVEQRPGAQRDEQHQHADATAVGIFEVHDEAVVDTVDRLDHPVDLARADADSAAVQRGVGAAGDHAAAAIVERDPVAVPPHARVRIEVGRSVPRAVGVAPEADRHRRHRLGDDQLTLLADDGATRPRRTPRPRHPGSGTRSRRPRQAPSGIRRRTPSRRRCRR